MISKEDVVNQLKTVNDPELGINIVDLGLVYEVRTKNNNVFVLLTLTFPGCPFGTIVNEEVNKALSALKKVGKISLKITFDPPWDLTKVSPEAAAEIGI
ncbi:MAG: metal-sulfur cluster assembly factor [bacterium]|nr:metal-sulfur cluster assembly factor [bacterium]